MSVIAAAVKAMMDGGMSSEAIVAAIATMEEALRAEAANDVAPSKGALRMRRYRARKDEAQSVTEASQVTDGDAPPNEYISNPPENPLSPKGDSPLAAQLETLTAEWNRFAGRLGLSEVRGKLSGPRKAQAQARLRDHGLDGMREAMAAIGRSPFCRGETTDFRANFDFLIRAKNATKLIEGGFDPPRTKPPPQSDLQALIGNGNKRIAAST